MHSQFIGVFVNGKRAASKAVPGGSNPFTPARMILGKEAKLLEEQIGSLVRKILIEPGLNLARERTKYFKIQVKGAENLQKLKGKPF